MADTSAESEQADVVNTSPNIVAVASSLGDVIDDLRLAANGGDPAVDTQASLGTPELLPGTPNILANDGEQAHGPDKQLVEDKHLVEDYQRRQTFSFVHMH